jgi:hypothetical protein
MVVHSYNSSTYETEAEDCEFKVSLGYTARSCHKTKPQKNKTSKGLQDPRREKKLELSLLLCLDVRLLQNLQEGQVRTLGTEGHFCLLL